MKADICCLKGSHLSAQHLSQDVVPWSEVNLQINVGPHPKDNMHMRADAMRSRLMLNLSICYIRNWAVQESKGCVTSDGKQQGACHTENCQVTHEAR